MSKLEIKSTPGSTPLDPNEIAGLIPDYITTQGELNALERDNIIEAVTWAFGKKHPDSLNVTFAFDLHKRMFNQVWKWAGKQRDSNKNIGVAKEQIHNHLGQLFGDTEYWIQNGTYPWDEIGARFHCRLAWIHAFANGNGRHARLMTDILLESNGQEPFSWGIRAAQDSIDVEGPIRNKYIAALKTADTEDYTLLLRFIRS